ncbi:MAG: UDP-N-acetylmuramoyl-tripeptide--D-alanyl-D-alanine ligase [Propionibacterium sp.]|nr:UDP-N-acetylmuramoyl-tripeptide--D-alanyl-D-alanine ligase [Propionibacterium sp.]
MKPRLLSELVELMQPAAVEVLGDDRMVGPDVVTDNRHVTDGAMFVAIPGERVDGHAYAPAAEAAGASCVVGMYQTDADVPHLLGEDSVQTLSWIARAVVAEARARGLTSIGVTGSSGKTSTKDLIAQLLERRGPTVAPVGSQNNEIGVPLTATRVDDDTRFLVSEMGARGIGHIGWLTSLVPLDIAVVLNVGQAHVGEFGGIDATAMAKAELIEDLGPDGWAVLHADDPLVAAMAGKTDGRIAWVGTGELPDGDLRVAARDVRIDALSRPRFTLEVTDADGTRTADVQLGVIGRHQVGNALSAAAVGVIVGMDVDDIAAALGEAVARSSWRMALSTLPGDALLLNDAYNANPDSMAAALRTAADIVEANRADHPDARLVAVLGDMLELGAGAVDAHIGIGRLAADLRFDEVVAVGEHAADVVRGAAEGVSVARVATREATASSLSLGPGDVVLIKGSRGIGLEAVATALEEEAK